MAEPPAHTAWWMSRGVGSMPCSNRSPSIAAMSPETTGAPKLVPVWRIGSSPVPAGWWTGARTSGTALWNEGFPRHGYSYRYSSQECPGPHPRCPQNGPPRPGSSTGRSPPSPSGPWYSGPRTRLRRWFPRRARGSGPPRCRSPVESPRGDHRRLGLDGEPGLVGDPTAATPSTTIKY